MIQLHEIIDSVPITKRHHLAVKTDVEEMTYQELIDNSIKMSSYLKKNGIKRGERVVILLANDINIPSLVYGISRHNAIFVILDEKISSVNLQYILKDTDASLVITSSLLIGKFQTVLESYLTLDIECLKQSFNKDRALSSELDDKCIFTGNESAAIIYTSGSTGKPKGILSTHHNIIFAATTIQKMLNTQESDVVGNFLPLSFDYGLYQIFLSNLSLCTMFLGNSQQIGPGFLLTLSNFQVTCLASMPSITSVLINLLHRGNTSADLKLQILTSTGSRQPVKFTKELERLIPNLQIFLMYGLTECKRVSILQPWEIRDRPTSVGRPLPMTECIILNHEGKELSAGEEGTLFVKGPHVMKEYWNNPELTNKRFYQFGEYLNTGDICYMDTEGYLYYCSRIDDVFKYKGYRVSTIEIEEMADSIEEVSLSAVIIDRERERAVLYYVGDLNEFEVRKKLSQMLEIYKVPPIITNLDQMPLTINGKIDKKVLHAKVKELL